MSTTTPFRFARTFPFCVKDLSSDLAGVSYIGNLTINQVMNFAWNLETFTINTNGSTTDGVNTANGNGAFTMNPAGGAIYDEGGGGGMWLTKGSSSVSANTAFASWPSAVIPIDRICYEDGARYQGTVLSISFRDSTNTARTFGGIDFIISTDPDFALKYRIYYYISFAYGDTGSGTVSIVFNSTPAPGIGAGTPFSSGTITIGGISFPWASAYSGTSASGTGAMTASSSDYTY